MKTPKRTKAKAPATISDVLRRTILDRLDKGLTKLELSRTSGVPRPSIIRFLRGERTLRLDMADKLAVALGLELRTNSNRPAKGTKAARQAARTGKLRRIYELASDAKPSEAEATLKKIERLTRFAMPDSE